MTEPTAKKERILYIITHGSRGGAQRNVLSLARGMKTAGFEVRVAFGQGGWLGDELGRQAIPTAALPGLERSFNPFTLLRYVIALRQELKTHPADVVHFHSSNAMAGVFALAGLKQRPKAVATVHGWSYLSPGWSKSLFLKRVYAMGMRQFLRRMDKVVFVCAHDEGLGKNHRMVKEGCGTVIMNGLAPFAMLPREEARAFLRGRHGAEREIIGTIARYEYAKGLDMVIEAAALLRGNRFLYCLVGEGQDEQDLKNHIERYNLEPVVRLVKPEGDPSALLSGFDLFVLPSRYEGLPYALLEACAAGLPIVATRVGGVPEVIRHNESGKLVPSGDPRALAREIQDLLENPGEARALGLSAQRIAGSVFSEERMVRETASLYQSIL